jgi:O-antigen/teichoic acid export membrane protein
MQVKSVKNSSLTVLINSLSSYARMGVSLVLGLLITRTALNVLTQTTANPQEVFGVFMLLLSLSTATQFINESIQQALIRFLTLSLHQADELQTKRWFSSGWVMSAVIGSAIALGMVGLAPYLIAGFNIPAPLIAPAQFMIRIAALVQVCNALSQPWAAGLGADDRYTLINIMAVVQQLITWLGLCFLPLLPYEPLIGLSLAWLLPSALIGAVLAGWVGYQKPLFRVDWRYIRWQDCQKLFALGGWSSLIGLASNLYERADQVLINLLLGPAANAIYAITIQMGGALNRLVTSFTSVLLPTASRVAAGDSPLAKQQLILRSTRYALTLALPCVCGVAIFRREIIEFWLGDGFELAIAVLPFTLLLVLCRMPIFVTWPYLTATNQLKLPALAIFLDGVCNIFLSIWYVKALNLGLFGIILGTLSTNLVRFIGFQIPFVMRLVALPPWQYWKQAYARPLSLMLGLVPILWVLESWQVPAGFTLILLGGAGIGYALAVWYWVLDQDEQKLFASLLHHRLKARDGG